MLTAVERECPRPLRVNVRDDLPACALRSFSFARELISLGVKAEARVASSMVERAAHSIVVAAGFGRAIRLSPGDHLRISLPDGPQVADMFAFVPPDLSEVLSTEHTRSC